MKDDHPLPEHEGTGYVHHDVDAIPPNSEKPGTRWELSPVFDIDAYNFNIADLSPGDRLSQNAYHRHPDQREFFYVVSGRIQVEAPDDTFELGKHEAVCFEEGVAHVLHNPFDEPARLIAIGDPPEGRRPVERIKSLDALLEDR